MAGLSRFLALVGLALLANGARSDILYWLIDQTDTPTEEQVPFQYAVMMSDAAGDPYGYVYQDEGGGSAFEPTDGLKTGENLAVLPNEPERAESFYFALYDGDFGLLAKSAVFSFAEAKAKGYVYFTNPIDPLQQPKTLVVSSFNVVPEPTGGVLALLGVAALALRRRGGKSERMAVLEKGLRR